MATRKRALTPRFYTAQAVARFCEVDLKTVHHWADKGKVPHRRTEGRHLRFRRNDIVRFLRAHGYPIADELARARVDVSIALPAAPSWTLSPDDLAKRLAQRFAVERHPSGAVGLAHLALAEPSAIVLALDDPSLAGARTIAALKERPETSWVVIAALGEVEALASARAAGAEVTLSTRDAAKLGAELARVLAVA